MISRGHRTCKRSHLCQGEGYGMDPGNQNNTLNAVELCTLEGIGLTSTDSRNNAASMLLCVEGDSKNNQWKDSKNDE